jgi:hypothetical protein
VPYNALLKRVRAEFLEMPGIRLKPEQVQRLCGVDGRMCQMLLDLLVDEGFLCVKSDGHYGRLTDATIQRPQPATADLRPPHRLVKAS